MYRKQHWLMLNTTTTYHYASSDDATEGEYGQDGMFLPATPIQGIVGIVRRLGVQHHIRTAACAMFQLRGMRRIGGHIVLNNDRAGHRSRCVRFEDTERHGDDYCSDVTSNKLSGWSCVVPGRVASMKGVITT